MVLGDFGCPQHLRTKMRAMTGFAKGMRSLRKPWVAWVALLMLANMVLPLVFIETLEAQLVLAAAVVGAVFCGARAN